MRSCILVTLLAFVAIFSSPSFVNSAAGQGQNQQGASQVPQQQVVVDGAGRFAFSSSSHTQSQQQPCCPKGAPACVNQRPATVPPSPPSPQGTPLPAQGTRQSAQVTPLPAQGTRQSAQVTSSSAQGTRQSAQGTPQASQNTAQNQQDANRNARSSGYPPAAAAGHLPNAAPVCPCTCIMPSNCSQAPAVQTPRTKTVYSASGTLQSSGTVTSGISSSTLTADLTLQSERPASDVAGSRIDDNCQTGCQTYTCCSSPPTVQQDQLSSAARSTTDAASLKTPCESCTKSDESDSETATLPNDSIKKGTAAHLRLSATPLVALIAAAVFMTL